MASTEEVQEKSPRGIPKAPFIVSSTDNQQLQRLTGRGVHPPNILLPPISRQIQSDVEKYIGGPDGDVESTLRNIQDALACVPLLTAI